MCYCGCVHENYLGECNKHKGDICPLREEVEEKIAAMAAANAEMLEEERRFLEKEECKKA